MLVSYWISDALLLVSSHLIKLTFMNLDNDELCRRCLGTAGSHHSADRQQAFREKCKDFLTYEGILEDVQI